MEPGYAMNTDNHYPQRQQHWPPPHLLPPTYSQFYPERPPTTSNANSNAVALSLNLSSLTVASPTNLSPINPPPATPSALSPVTPISPSTNHFQHHHHHHHPGHTHHHIQSPFQFDPASSNSPYEPPPSSPLVSQPPPSSSSGAYETRTPAPSRSSSSSGIAGATTTTSSSSSSTTTSQLPRKRSFTGSNLNSPTSASKPSSTTTSTNGVAPPTRDQNQSLTVNVNLSSSTSTSTTTTTLLEEEEPMLYDDEARDAAMELASPYDDMEVRTAYGVVLNHTHSHGALGTPHGHHALHGGMNYGNGGMGSGNAGNGSPVDGSGSTSGAEDSFGGGPGSAGGVLGMGSSMNILGKPVATNNFVTKLYQMINDPKSTQFIAWTDLGTSFVVSNVGEFSRSILGSHFKHNNFSSFVRQLNMYGFHKINRTPRAQRTSTDAQTWEFSHHKFLRGRPDLLDEIKRKALEPDPAIKHRVELPGEVAAQLGAMRDENRRVWDQLTSEKRKVEKLVSVVGRLWDVVGKGFPGHLPQFPPDLLETSDSPNIYVTSPTISSSRFQPPPLSMNVNMMHSLNSPNSSPTASDFQGGGHYHQHGPHVHHHHHPQHQQQHHTPSRQHGFQAGGSGYSRTGDSNSSTPLPSSPGSISMDLFDDGCCDGPPSGRPSTKRQRLDDGGGVGVNGMNGGIGGLVGGGGGGGGPGNSSDSMGLLSSVSSPGAGVTNNGLATLTVPKKSSRARSDSAPLGYAMHSWQQQQLGGSGSGGGGNGRPRSGSGMGPLRLGMAGIGRSGNASTPLLSITTAESDMGDPR